MPRRPEAGVRAFLTETGAGLMIDAFHTVAIGTRDEIARALRQRGPRSAAGRLLDAVLAQYDGDVDAAIRQLRSLVASGGAEGSYAADVLAPILMMRSLSLIHI